MKEQMKGKSLKNPVSKDIPLPAPAPDVDIVL
jgi:hypothetical protein